MAPFTAVENATIALVFDEARGWALDRRAIFSGPWATTTNR